MSYIDYERLRREQLEPEYSGPENCAQCGEQYAVWVSSGGTPLCDSCAKERLESVSDEDILEALGYERV